MQLELCNAGRASVLSQVSESSELTDKNFPEKELHSDVQYLIDGRKRLGHCWTSIAVALSLGDGINNVNLAMK